VGISDPLTSKGFGNFAIMHIFVIGLPIPSDSLPEFIEYPLELLTEGVRCLGDLFQEGYTVNMQSANLAAIPLEDQQSKLKSEKQL
jgi:hypothetical protein